MADCRAGCLLEGISLQELPPYSSYHAGQELGAKEGTFLICQGPVGFCWHHSPMKCLLEVLGPGDFILWERVKSGEGGDEQHRVEAVGEVQGRWLGRRQWLELLRHPLVQERFLEYTRRRWQRQREWQLVLAHGSVRARLAWQLVDLAQRFGEREGQTQEIFVPIALTQEQQAQLIGATRARLWEALREFEHRRWLVCGLEGFLIRDEGALRRQSLEGL